MAEEDSKISLTIVAFGPLGDVMDRRQEIQAPKGSTVGEVISILNLQHWLKNGLTLAINGDRCKDSSTLSNGDELALLPPVSGG